MYLFFFTAIYATFELHRFKGVLATTEYSCAQTRRTLLLVSYTVKKPARTKFHQARLSRIVIKILISNFIPYVPHSRCIQRYNISRRCAVFVDGTRVSAVVILLSLEYIQLRLPPEHARTIRMAVSRLLRSPRPVYNNVYYKICI